MEFIGGVVIVEIFVGVYVEGGVWDGVEGG